MGTKSNIANVAFQLKVDNEGGLNEDQLLLKGARFYSRDGKELAHIEGTPLNKGARLFLQLQLLVFQSKCIDCDEKFRLVVKDFFQDSMTDPAPSPTQRTFLYHMLTAGKILPVFK